MASQITVTRDIWKNRLLNTRNFMYKVIALFLAVQVYCDQYPQRYEGVKNYEKAYGYLLDVIAQFIPNDPVIFEAGGHYGTDTVAFAKKWPEGKVISFEPNPHAFEMLSQATKDFKNVSVYPLAVSDQNEQAILNVCYGTTGDNPIYEGASSLLEASECQEIHYQGPKIEVSCVVLDDWCKENGIDHIDFMWLDLEGLELYVLNSSPKILDSVRLIFTETNFFEFRKEMTQYADLKAFLEKSRFKMIAHWYAEGLQGNAIFVKKEEFEN